MHFLKQYIVNPIRDFIYPPVCLVCNQLLIGKEQRVCSACWNSFTSIERTNPTWIELKARFSNDGFVKDILSCYLFEKDGKLQDVIHLLKYQGMKALGVRLGEEIGRKIISNGSFMEADFLVPVPLHTLKMRERGYNQSESICKGISDITKIPVKPTIIERKKYTQSQTQLNHIERKGNVSDAFVIPEKYQSYVKGNIFILADDVITTGATVNACAQELTTLGAGKVLAVSVALAK